MGIKPTTLLSLKDELQTKSKGDNSLLVHS